MLSKISDIHAYAEQFVLIEKKPKLLTSMYVRYSHCCKLSSETPLNVTQNIMRNAINRFGEKQMSNTAREETVTALVQLRYD